MAARSGILFFLNTRGEEVRPVWGICENQTVPISEASLMLYLRAVNSWWYWKNRQFEGHEFLNPGQSQWSKAQRQIALHVQPIGVVIGFWVTLQTLPRCVEQLSWGAKYFHLLWPGVMRQMKLCVLQWDAEIIMFTAWSLKLRRVRCFMVNHVKTLNVKKCAGSGRKRGGKQELYLNDLTSSVSIKIAPVVRG